MRKNSRHPAGERISPTRQYNSIRVGMVFLNNPNDALRFDELASATSEFRWLEPKQYLRRGKRVRLVPGASTELSEYANANRLHPLGVVIVNEQGSRSDILIKSSLISEYHEAAQVLLRQHADFWCLDRQSRA